MVGRRERQKKNGSLKELAKESLLSLSSVNLSRNDGSEAKEQKNVMEEFCSETLSPFSLSRLSSFILLISPPFSSIKHTQKSKVYLLLLRTTGWNEHRYEGFRRKRRRKRG